MEYKRIGLDLKVSIVGVGCWAMGGHGYGVVDDNESIMMIQRALGLGLNLFDTADVYGFGHSEYVLSKALGNQRGNVVVATKGGVRWNNSNETWKDSSPEYLRKALEASLRRLRVETVSLYQLHWHDGMTPIEDSLGELERLKLEGKIKNIGVSNVGLELLDKASNFPIVTNQLEFNYLQRGNELLIEDQHKKYGIDTLVYGGLARGMLSGKYSDNSVFGKGDTRSSDPMFNEDYEFYKDKLKELTTFANKACAEPSELALSWIMQKPEVASILVGAKTAAQVEANIRFVSMGDLAKDLG